MKTIQAYAAMKPGLELEEFSYEVRDELEADQVEIEVESCGICHSDLSMLQNQWGMSAYPLVAGHEVIGRIAAVGDHVRHVQPGQRVGLGWFAGSCMTCLSTPVRNWSKSPVYDLLLRLSVPFMR